MVSQATAGVLIALGAVMTFFILPMMQINDATPLEDLSPKFRGGQDADYYQNDRRLWLYPREWTVPSPKAVVFLTHGMAEHSGRYGGIAKALNDIGVSVYSFDLAGHGYSEGERLYAPHINSHINDLLQRVRNVKVPEGIPVFGMGHSMGGLITLLTQLHRPETFKGLILSGPAIMDSVETPIDRETLIKLGSYLVKYLPHLPVAKIDGSKIAVDQEVVRDAKEDPLVAHGASIRAAFAFSLINGQTEALKKAPKFKTPLLLMQGDKDEIVKPEGARKLCAAVASTDKTCKHYEELGHEVLFEGQRHEEVVNDLTSWIKAHM